MIPDWLTATTPGIRLLKFLVILIVGAAASRGVIMPLASYLYRGDDNKARSSLTNLAGILALFATFILALNTAGFGNLVTVLTALGAAATVAVGFGVRDQIANLVAGVLIHVDNPFIKGDQIAVNDQHGEVKDIKLRTTTVKTRAGKHVIPNAALTTNTVLNKTRGNTTTEQITTEIQTEHAQAAKRHLDATIASNNNVRGADPTTLTTTTNHATTITATYTTTHDPAIVKNELLTSYTNRLDDNDII
jgi:small-conductance mechanosensitive channel